MTGQAVLMKELDGLPPEYMGEVTDFVAWLKHRKLQFGGNGNNVLSSQKKPNAHELFGMYNDGRLSSDDFLKHRGL